MAPPIRGKLLSVEARPRYMPIAVLVEGGHAKRQPAQGDPVLAWMLGNVVGHYDVKENVYPRRERPENKIDGPVALIMALGGHMVPEQPPNLNDFLRNPIMLT